MRPRLAHALLLALLTFALVTSFEAVGSLLVFAFLIAPAASATLVASATMALTSVAIFLLIVTAMSVRRGVGGTRLDAVVTPAAAE